MGVSACLVRLFGAREIITPRVCVNINPRIMKNKAVNGYEN